MTFGVYWKLRVAIRYQAGAVAAVTENLLHEVLSLQVPFIEHRSIAASQHRSIYNLDNSSIAAPRVHCVSTPSPLKMIFLAKLISADGSILKPSTKRALM